MTNALVTADEFDTLQRVAKAMTASGYFQDARDIAQAVVKIMAGAELGLPPFAAMTGLHIIKGRPALGANLIATLIKNDHRYDYRVLKLDDGECSIAFFEGGQQVGISTFTIADARRAGTQNLDKFPRNMLFARALSNGAKWFTPGVFGGAPVYTPEELGAQVDEDGNVLEGEIVAPIAIPEPPTNGNGKQPEPAINRLRDGDKVRAEQPPTTSTAADYRAWLETQSGPTIPLSLVAQGAVRLNWYHNADSVYTALQSNPLIKQYGVICKAETHIKPASAVMLWDWLEGQLPPVQWDDLTTAVDETTAAAGPAAQ